MVTVYTSTLKTNVMKTNKKNIIEEMVCSIYRNIGIDRPANHRDIVQFIFEDVNETADPELWHSGDVEIAFRRFLEKDYEV